MIVCWNVMSLVSDARTDEVLEGLHHHGFSIAVLIGTKLRLCAKHDGWDVYLRNRCIVVSFGHRGDFHGGCAIVLNAEIFSIADIANVWKPNDTEIVGRVGMVRIKRKECDFSVIAAYPTARRRVWLCPSYRQQNIHLLGLRARSQIAKPKQVHPDRGVGCQRPHRPNA
jgi:hypothetical protein